VDTASLTYPAVSDAASIGEQCTAPGLPGGVQIANLSVRFGARTVLDDLSLTIERGELLTVLGRSGCGKTTLLRFIAGFLQGEVEHGTLTVAGRDMTHLPPHQRKLGLLFQNYALFPHLSVFENIAFGLRARRVAEADIRSRVADALRLVQLDDAGRTMPAQLSGGMQQRVALARALVVEPDVLLLDEPLSALDANLRAAVRSELKALHQRLPHLTIVCVTHDQEDALVLSDRTLLLRDGKIAQLGTPQQLYDTPHDGFVARYLGAANLLPPALLLPGSDPRAADTTRVACLRPEALSIVAAGAGRLDGVVADVQWHGAALTVSVVLDALPREPVQVVQPRHQAGALGPGDRVSLTYEVDDVTLIQP